MELFPERRKSLARPPLTVALLLALFVRALGRCERCRGLGPFHVDHVRPWSESFRHVLENLQLLGVPCHYLKTTGELDQRPHWREARRRAEERRQARLGPGP